MAINIKYPVDFQDMKYFITFRCRDYKYKNKQSLNEVEIEKISLCNISIYFPSNFSENINQEWNPAEMISAGSIVGKALDIFKNRAGAGIFNKLNPGIAINPSEEVLYQGPGWRSFDFNFDLIARNKEELKVVKRIEALFKILSLPRLAEDVTYIAFPAIWEIEIKGIEDDENGELFSLGYKNKYFALTSYTVQYTPDGNYYPLIGGHPVKTNINLSFKETSPLYRKEISGETPIKGIISSIEDFITASLTDVF